MSVLAAYVVIHNLNYKRCGLYVDINVYRTRHDEGQFSNLNVTLIGLISKNDKLF